MLNRLNMRLLASLIALVTLIGAADAASASNNKAYRAFATCSAFTPDPDRRCYFGNGFGATIIAKKRDRVRYTLCVTDKSTGAKDCFSKRTRRAGQPSSVWLFNKAIVSDVGKYRLKWRVPGQGIIARATLTMLLGD
jgi:hypothetical protein